MKKLVNSMITPKDRNWRSLSAALGLFGFLGAGPNALAAWYGQNTGEKMQPLASMAVRSNRPTVFTWDTASRKLWEVWQYAGQWNSSLVYSQPNAERFAASATYFQNALGPAYDTYFVAHLDSDGQLRLSSWLFADQFGGWTTQVVDSGTPTAGDTVAAKMFNDNLYIFYTSFNGITNTLKVASYNGKTTTLDGDGKLPGSVVSNIHQPTAVPAPDGLHVYYFSSNPNTLREAVSKDGVNWTFNVIGNAYGYSPSAIVYQNNTYTTINVFYTDMQNKLRVWYAQLGTGNWNTAVVDDIITNGNNAPVINGGIQVYYVSPGGQVRVAYGAAANALTLAAIDGNGPGDLTTIQTGTGVQDVMDATVTAVEVSGVGPSAFYYDTGSPNKANTGMRNAYWK